MISPEKRAELRRLWERYEYATPAKELKTREALKMAAVRALPELLDALDAAEQERDIETFQVEPNPYYERADDSPLSPRERENKTIYYRNGNPEGLRLSGRDGLLWGDVTFSAAMESIKRYEATVQLLEQQLVEARDEIERLRGGEGE